MVRSMTGYGRNQLLLDGYEISVEIKSVNHRYFEFSARVPRGYGFLEEKLKNYVSEKVSRGKIEVNLFIQAVGEDKAEVALNHALVSGYLAAFEEISQKYGVPNDVTVSTLTRLPELFTVLKAPEDGDAVWSAVRQVLKPAVEQFVQMREFEGQKLREDVLSRGQAILSMVERVEARSPQTVALYMEKLTQRMEELLGGACVEEQRILTEAAIFADKIAVAEETVRLRSHFEQLRQMMDGKEAIGRKLDFLLQEMNREANTIGSKAQDTDIARVVVDIKAELEKIREQIQNIE